MSSTLAEKRVNDFKNKYGKVALQLAYHAALPVALNADLLHLLRINFFLDPPKPLPYTAEFELLLSPLCREIDEGLYEIEPEIRDILLQGLCSIDRGQRIKDVANLLWKYIDRDAVWIDRVELERAQQFTVLNFLDLEEADRWLAEADATVGLEQTASREWFIAVCQDRDRIAISTEKVRQEIKISDAADKAHRELYREIIERHFEEIAETIADNFANGIYNFQSYSKDGEDSDIDEIYLNDVDTVKIKGILGEIDLDIIFVIFKVSVKIKFSVKFTKPDRESYIKEIHEDAGYSTITGTIPNQFVTIVAQVNAILEDDEDKEFEIERIDLITPELITVDYSEAIFSESNPDDFNEPIEDEENTVNISASDRQKITTPKVVISYSHDSLEHKERVLALADRLRMDGIDANIDQYEAVPPEGWPRWMLDQVYRSDFVLIACSEEYDRRFQGNEAYGKGKGATWDGDVIIQELYDAQGNNSKFIPITFNWQDYSFIPSPLLGATYYRLDTNDGYELLYRRLTNQEKISSPAMVRIKSLPLPPRDRQHNLSADVSLKMKVSSQIIIHSLSQIRQLIEGALSDDELSNLCQDKFSWVYNQFTSNQTRSQLIRLLCDHVKRQQENSKLLNAIEQINPAAYHDFIINNSQQESQENLPYQVAEINKEAQELLMTAFDSNDKLIFVVETTSYTHIIAGELNFVDRPELLTTYQYAIAQLVEKEFITKMEPTNCDRYELTSKGYEFCIEVDKSPQPDSQPPTNLDTMPVSKT
jgi:SEFIR domain/Effector-associated domain 7